jgi:hypothetical protein
MLGHKTLVLQFLIIFSSLACSGRFLSNSTISSCNDNARYY